MKSIIRFFVSIGLYYTGAIKLFGYLKKRSDKNTGIKILAYHDISDKSYLNLHLAPKIFNQHMNYLIKHDYNIIPLTDAVNLLKNNEHIPENTVVITFDDVYKSFYTTVYPIIKQYKIPITIFICTEPVEKRYPLFIDALIYAFDKTQNKTLDLTHWNLKEYSIKSKVLKENAMNEINEYSKNLKNDISNKLLKFIFEQLHVDFNDPELRNNVVSWDEILEMSRNNSIEFGAQTNTHPSLSRIPIADAKDEILKSKKIIQGKLRKDVKTFAYPYGSSRDVNEEVKESVKQFGFSCACVLQTGINNVGDDLFLLRRMCITNQIKPKLLWFFTKAVFATQMSDIFKLFFMNKFNMIEKEDADKVNILFMIDKFDDTGAGTERHLANLVTNLDGNRFKSRVYYFKGEEDWIQQEIQKKEIPVENFNVGRIYSFKSFIKAFQLAVSIKKNNIDIVQTFHFKSDTYGVFVSRLAGITKIISSRRDTGDLKKPRQIFLNKLINHFVSRYIMVCDAVAEKVYQNEKVPRDKMTIIYNGVDLKRFALNNNILLNNLNNELGIKKDDFIVGTTAIFRQEKAYHIFFEGIENVLPFIKNLKVLVLGEGVTRSYFENNCNKGPLRNVVKFMGYVNDVENYLPLIDVFCLVPNKNEGFSNAILEAMATGKPVIATEIGGNAEAVIHNETGIIIPPDDSEKLSEAIIYLYNNPSKREEMGRRGRERTKQLFTLEKMIKNHENFYEEIFNVF